MVGVIPSSEFNDQLVKTVKDVLRQLHSPVDTSSRYGGRRVRRHWAICNEDIAGADNAATAPSTGEVEILTRNTVSGDLERSGVKHELTHRYESIDLVADTLIRIENADGEWIVTGADCEPMAVPL
tara:strand:+ start:503 stop:880 length:378 start_codon:yes stop_codon:yes gene_type:complete